MSDPPSESEDSDRTVILPSPVGRRRAPALQRPIPAAPSSLASPGAPNADTIMFSTRPLLGAAMPLLNLLSLVHNLARHPDPGDLRERAVRALRDFEQRARDAGVPHELVRPAHYALCASIDDAVLNTPWGVASDWGKHRLVPTLHRESGENDRFYDLLARLKRDPSRFMPALEVMYLCLSLGYVGRFRHASQGSAELERLRAATGALIVGERKAAGTELSDHWKGLAAPYRAVQVGFPMWVAYAAALGVCGALFVWVSTAVNAASDDQYHRMLAAPPVHMPQISRTSMVRPLPPAPPPPQPGSLDRLRSSLSSDINTGYVSVAGTEATPIIRIRNSGGFPPGSARLQPTLAAVLERVGAALRNEPGTVQVIEYTDNQPIHTVRFPSNFQLSSARAEAAGAAIARALGDKARLHTEGRGDADPIASNETAVGREQNRRTEVVLHPRE
jgi:type VI secretion system protein ImpK